MPKKAQLNNLEEANAALRALGAAQRNVAKLEAAAQRKIDFIKEDLDTDRLSEAAVVRSLTRLLSDFARRHSASILKLGAKTVQLQFGKIGMRTPPQSLVLSKGWTEDDVVAAIKARFAKPVDQATYIITSERICRDTLKTLDEADLAELGLEVKQDDVPVVEAALDVVEDVA